MDHTARLMARLDAIAQALARLGPGLALIALGSSGAEQQRLDRYSDLDFFVIVRDGHKPALLEDLGWLEAIAPIAYRFRNTDDGYKLLFADGIFCEQAFFEARELADPAFAGAWSASGRVIWQADGFDAAGYLARPIPAGPPARDAEWLLGEALTNLLVGLGRYHRGERLSAARFIQGYAVDRVLELAARIEAAQPVTADPYAIERRFEQRFPQTARLLPQFVPGYDGSVAAAAAILTFLEQHFAVNGAIAAEIRALCGA